MRLPGSRRFRRVGAGATAAAVAAAVVAFGAPAGAEPTARAGADLAVSVPGPQLALNSALKSVHVDVRNNGPVGATGVKLHIELSGLVAGVEFVPSADLVGCRTDGPVTVCPLGDLPAFGNRRALAVDVIPNQHAIPAGSVIGRLTVRVTADQVDPNPQDNTRATTLKLVPNAVDLRVSAEDPAAEGPGARVRQIRPGGVGLLEFALVNEGTVAVDSVEVAVTLPRYVTFLPAEDDDACDVSDGGAGIVCRYGGIDAGTGQRRGKVRIRVAPNAPGPWALTGGSVNATGLPAAAPAAGPAAPAAARRTLAPRDAQRAEERSTAPDAAPGDNVAPFTVFTDRNPADLVAVGGVASGRVGEVVQVVAGYRNDGPADAVAEVTFTAPAGTEFAQPVPGCAEVTPKRVLRCGHLVADGRIDLADKATVVGVGRTVELPLTLTILAGTVVDGSVEVKGSGPDERPGNDRAALKVTVVTGGLPITGARAGVYGAVGLGALTLGGGLLLLTRRRRVPPVAPGDGA